VRLKASGGFDSGREAVGPVVTVPGEAADALGVAAHHQAVAVVFDLVDPQRAGRRSGHLRRQTRFDEAGGTPHDHLPIVVMLPPRDPLCRQYLVRRGQDEIPVTSRWQ